MKNTVFDNLDGVMAAEAAINYEFWEDVIKNGEQRIKDRQKIRKQKIKAMTPDEYVEYMNKRNEELEQRRKHREEVRREMFHNRLG